MGKEKLGGGLLAATGIGVPWVADMMGLTIPAPWGWLVLGLFGVLGLAGLIMLFRQNGEPTTSDEPEREMGDDNTVYGDVQPRKMGSRNTIVGATDERGNTIVRGGTSVGYGAGHNPTSVIIGSGAGASLNAKSKLEGGVRPDDETEG